MIIITGSATINSEHFDTALKLGIAHSRRSRTEPGCIAHNCLIDAESPLRIVFIEEWTDMAAVAAHFAEPESGIFVRELTAIADDQPEIRIFSAEDQRR
jgi:quinol monooxygenase YgiN